MVVNKLCAFVTHMSRRMGEVKLPMYGERYIHDPVDRRGSTVVKSDHAAYMRIDISHHTRIRAHGKLIHAGTSASVRHGQGLTRYIAPG